MTTELALLSKAELALDRLWGEMVQARTIEEKLQVRDRADVFERYLRRLEGAERLARKSTEIRIRTETDIGEILKETVHRGGAKSHRATLPDGVTKSDSSRWQKLAWLAREHRETFERELEKAEPTTARLVKLAKQLSRPGGPTPGHRGAEYCSVADLQALIATGQRFGTIYADPPWQYGNQGTRASTDNHYSTMPVDEIAALPVEKLAADNAHLHLWTTNAFLPVCFDLMRDWGFEYKGVFVWVKPEMGIGNYWRVSHEFMLLGIRGRAPFASHAEMSWLCHPRTPHSAKPEKVRQAIEKVSAGPYLELFGRRLAPGWVVWGNEIERTMFDGAAREIG